MHQHQSVPAPVTTTQEQDKFRFPELIRQMVEDAKHLNLKAALDETEKLRRLVCLMRKAQQIILKEEEHYSLQFWEYKFGDVDPEEVGNSLGHHPVCGTVRCICGWMGHLEKGEAFGYSEVLYSEFPQLAEQLQSLFLGNWDQFEYFHEAPMYSSAPEAAEAIDQWLKFNNLDHLSC